MKQIKIRASNWDELLCNPPMRFQTFINGSYARHKEERSKKTFQMVKYTCPEDIIYALTMRIKNQLNGKSIKATVQREKWEHMISCAEKLIKNGEE